ncbi:ABC transporter permease [Rhodovulum sulfidophilum]|uniref:ABC transporter permease n=1 Tax=Rhodovulum sulfidophilum TaxID=35806 RepID=UPI0009526B7C|nr:ABC transporter permease [Rhodovulum sulfidophilum]MCE8417726.1 ABC transporter permease [Rhodovulum sulfidophilum]MCE8439523.1 ABC transporter permease [Rhodovulum sulfidophilum]NDK36682.1 ABC transporter permease [Rhodovulum sulfidophilum]OLS51749.1 D-ala-D-ala transporter subunit [Rhodovulum sulfidophilum]
MNAVPDTPLRPRREGLRRALSRFRQSRLSTVGAGLVALVLATAALGPFLAPYPDHVAGGIDTAARFLPPSAGHPFGTNELGQDVLSLTLAGASVSVLAGFAVVLIGSAIGTLVGGIAGFAGGWIDEILMRLTDLVLTVPNLILAMAIAAALGPGFQNMVLAISLGWWPGYARLVRGEVLSAREEVYVTAARAMGASRARVLFCHVLPNCISPVIVKMSLDMGFAILAVAALGFIGIGVRPPVPEWGTMLATARSYMPDVWWTAMAPGLAIFVSVFGFNLLGDGLRDLLDPRGGR